MSQRPKPPSGRLHSSRWAEIQHTGRGTKQVDSGFSTSVADVVIALKYWNFTFRCDDVWLGFKHWKHLFRVTKVLALNSQLCCHEEACRHPAVRWNEQEVNIGLSFGSQCCYEGSAEGGDASVVFCRSGSPHDLCPGVIASTLFCIHKAADANLLPSLSMFHLAEPWSQNEHMNNFLYVNQWNLWEAEHARRLWEL